MSDEDRERWDARFSERTFTLDRTSPELVAHIDDLRPGRSLDVACGVGANALWLAARGFEVVGVDISPVGLSRLRRAAFERGLSVDARCRDLDAPDALEDLGRFDSIVISRFTPPRELWPRLANRLVAGGRLLIATHNSRHHAATGRGARWCLAPGELLRVEQTLEVVRYEENVGLKGTTDLYIFERRARG